jgi:hypothetical protein
VTRPGPGSILPAAVRILLDGFSLADKTSTTVLLATTTADGWPNVAMLSPGEVLATDPTSLRIALYANSKTCRSLRADGRAVVSLVADGAAYRIRISARHVPEPPIPGADELFLATVAEVTEDRVPYARVTHGVEYELEDVAATLARWEEKLRRLRSLSAAE